MSAVINIIETTTELGLEVVEVVVASSSTPGPAGPGVPTGGTTGQLLAKDTNADYDTEWVDADAPGAHAASHQDGGSDEISLTGLSGIPAALTTHEADTTAVHGIADTSALALTANHPSNATFNDHSARHEDGGADEISIAGLSGTSAELQAHLDDTSDAHDASAISFTPDGSIAATTVQAAIVEVRDEAGGGGAPTDVDYLVGTASGGLSNEIVAGTSPGGELGGTWASPTVDASHSGSTHAAVQAAAEATAAAALSAHLTDTADAHDASAISVDSTTLVGTGTDAQAVFEELDNSIADHLADATAAHAGTAISVDSTNLSGTSITVQGSLEELDNLLDDHSARHENGGADEISIAGLDGTPTELTNHLSDSSDAHDASAISFTPAGTIAATDVQAAIEEVATEAGGGGVPSLQYESRSSNTILGTADKGKTIDITAAITQTFEADETLGDGWWVELRNATDDGSTEVVLNPAGTETIDGLTTVTMYSGETRRIFCNGAGGNFNSVLRQGGYRQFTADGNFIVPHGITKAVVDLVGAGGGGGGGRGGSAGSARQGGSGGGGGARVQLELPAEALGNPGDTIAIDVATGGTFGAGGSAADGSNGGVGGTTTFGSLLSAFGGGNGIGGSNTANHRSGGGGGGAGRAGGTGVNNAGSTGGGQAGAATITANATGMGGVGAGCTVNGPPFAPAADWGGGCGGVASLSGTGPGAAGGQSQWGGGGGGGAGGLPTGNTEQTGSAGGDTGVMVPDGAGGGTAGAVDGGAGGVGADGDLIVSGQGGGGGGSQASGTGGAGGNGGVPGGGGGGGGAGTTVGGAGGAGGRGEVRVWYS
jgi:hypothetical protein